ncbi:MAG: lipid-A-disaccharide synthase [Phycisphaerae bacterium]|nr:lipid-A-disaccharide synthase [Phycisphaerae bacterium]
MIIISALDNSGQLYAADLVRILRQQMPEQKFIGIGGPDLAAAGCELIHDISDSSAMLTGIFGALKWAVPAFRRLKKIMASEKVDLVILVDSPTFNLPLAKAARKHGIKTLYYIAPQIWAWAEHRWRRIRRRVDQLAVILPFEQAYFQKFGIHAQFVGHPFINHIKDAPVNESLNAELSALPHPVLLLMPGSRRHVVEELLPAQLRIVRQIQQKTGPMTLALMGWKGVAPTIERLVKEGGFEFRPGAPESLRSNANIINIFFDDRKTLIENSNLVLAASGTGTLEVAWHGRPMLIMYNTSKWFYHLIGRWLIRTRFFSLLNNLAQKEIVPEFMPYIRDEAGIADKAVELLQDNKKAAQLGLNIQSLVRNLYHQNPADDVAQLARKLITSSSHRS